MSEVSQHRRTFTTDELTVIETALFAYQMETESYLRRSPAPEHDPCCEKAKARQQEHQKQCDSLESRLALIKSAQAKI